MMEPYVDRTVTILVLKHLGIHLVLIHLWYSPRCSVFPTKLCAVTKLGGREALEHSASHYTDTKAIN